MKVRYIILFLVSFFSFNIYANETINYITNGKTVGYYYRGRESKDIKKNYRFCRIQDSYFFSWIEINERYVYVIGDYSDNEYKDIPIAFVELENCKIKLPENIITINKEGLNKKAIPFYLLEVLNSDNRETLRKFNCFVPYDANLNCIYRTYNGFCEGFNSFAIISNIGIRMHNFDEIDFIKINKISDSIYECESILYCSYENEKYDSDSFFEWRTNIKTSTPPNQSETIRLTIDGDYLIIDNITRNENITTLVYVTDSLVDELNKLFRNEKVNRANITWPRHADGTCDYDGSSKKATTANTSQPKTSETTKAVSNTNVAVNKTMSTNCNLKLRSGEATSTQVLTVMSAGTKVKILELGKAETIDGINSNWVKVEVLSGAKDRDGKEIKAGTVGWCYGGYLE